VREARALWESNQPTDSRATVLTRFPQIRSMSPTSKDEHIYIARYLSVDDITYDQVEFNSIACPFDDDQPILIA
jgi:hypothetical protein